MVQWSELAIKPHQAGIALLKPLPWPMTMVGLYLRGLNQLINNYMRMVIMKTETISCRAIGIIAFSLLSLCFTLPVWSAPGGRKTPANTVTYRDVAPIFQKRCIRCHYRNSTHIPPRQLSLESYRNIMIGGEDTVVIPGYPRGSELYRRITGMNQPRMPFDGPPWLGSQDIVLIGQWIAQGARDIDGKVPPTPVGRKIQLKGRLTGYWAINGVPLVVDAYSQIKEYPRYGDNLQIQAVVGEDGRIYVRHLRKR